MSVPILIGIALVATGCGLNTQGTADEDYGASHGGAGGASGGRAGAAGASGAGQGGAGGSSAAGGIAGFPSSGGVSGAGGSSGSAGEGGTAAGMSGASGIAGVSGQAGQGGSSGQAGQSGQGGLAGAGEGGMSGMSGMGGLAGMAGQSGQAGQGGLAGMGGVAGMSGMSGAGGGPLDMFMPEALRPAMDQTLPPTRAYLLWKDGPIPSGLTIAGYDVCSTSGPMTTIDDVNECPNMVTVADSHLVLDPLSSGGSYLWKVRTHFSDTSMSAYSGVQKFTSDNSLVSWWRMNGNVTDSTPPGANGSVQNGASFGSGIDGEALVCNGVNQYADMGSNAKVKFSGPLTISAWVYGEGVPTSADSGIVNNGVLNYALTYHTDGNVWFYIGSGDNHLNAKMTPGGWHHVTGIFDGTTAAGGMRLYLDSAAAGTRASSAATTGATESLSVGRYNSSYFHGSIDNVTLYNEAISEAAILNEYCATQASGGAAVPKECLP